MDYPSAEAETRRTRPPTRTLEQAVRVFLESDTPNLISDLAAASLLGRALSGPFRARELAAPVAVAAAWPVLEWAAHRWLLHLEPKTFAGLRIDPFFARAHRRHHANPAHYPWVLLPKRVVVGSYLGFAATLAALTRDRRWVFTGMASVSVAALVYEWVHYVAHTDYQPEGAWLKRVVRRHRLHHYRSEQHWYAFTVPDVDDWLGTGGELRDVPASGTVRDLGIDDGGAFGRSA